MKISKKGIDLITKFEGLELEAYQCPAGVWTIGYGHTENVKKGDKITKEQAIDLLKKDVAKYENAVNKFVKVTLNQNQFDALVSFTFNVGEGNFRVSTLLKRLNEKSFLNASKQFKVWNKARVKGVLTELKGLTRRRKAEQELFDSEG